MKKILLTTIAVAGCGVGAFGQGTIIFENANVSSAAIRTSPGNALTGSGLTVELLWFNGSSFVVENTFTSTYTGGGTVSQGPGFFNAGQVTLPTYNAQGTFEVEASYNGYSGTTASFTATEGEPPTLGPGTTAVHPAPAGSWNGSMTLTQVPEPSTIALGGLGVAALLLFRRRK